MQKSLGIAAVAAVLMGLQSRPAQTDGCMMPSNYAWKQRREKALINEPDQKALLFYSKGKEQLIISPSYAGEAQEFAWVIPVPARPRVEILQGAPFHELARLVAPAPPANHFDAGGRRYAAKTPPAVTVIERKTIGDYDVSVLAATDSQALVRWLRENQYHLPEKAAAPIQAYIKEGWTFVASKIRLHDTAKGLKTGTLTPLRLIFDSPNPVYPMRLSAANPGRFSLLVYIALPLEEAASGPGPFTLQTIKSPGSTSLSLRQATLSKGQTSAFPTLTKLNKNGMRVYWLKTSLQPAACDRDFVWTNTTQ